MATSEFIAMIGGMFVMLMIGSLAFIGITPLFAIGEGIYIAIAATFNTWVLLATLQNRLTANSLLIIPVIIGALAFTRLTKYRWAARYTIAIMSGVGTGVVFSASVKAQIMSTIQKVVGGVITGTPDPISAWVTFIPMILTPLAFTYSMKYSGWLLKGRGRHLFTAGRTFFMIFVGGRMGELAGTSLMGYIGGVGVMYLYRPITALMDVLSGAIVLT
ncbi:MAG: hypothetical protein NWF13_02760 [Candidatus Bathyarchaeota archaeon]|nr:hypothetical protein [Candidatus Bathyarchaeota archaeon]